jgi:hypothetical protein
MTKSSIATSFKNNKGWHILLLIILPLIIYTQAIHFDYTNFDDNKIIKDKFALVGNIKHLRATLEEDPYFNRHGSFYRPVQNVSFMLDAQVSGNKLWMFHITNLMLHILSCIALYYFLQLFAFKRLTAFYMALLFSVHPLFASDIGWIPARGDLLIGLGGLLLFISFHHYLKQYKTGWLLLHFVLFSLLVFTKETAIIFPLLLLFYYFSLLDETPCFNTGIQEIKKLVPFFIIWCSTLIFYLYMRRNVVTGIGNDGRTVFFSFLKNWKAMPIIVGKFFVPVHLSTLPLFDTASTITGIIFFLLLLYATYKYSMKKKWIVLFGLLWFLLFAIPPAIYRLRNSDIFFNYLEHRSYLPMMGILIIVGFIIDNNSVKPFFYKYFPRLYVTVIILLGSLAYIHCADYKNTLAVTACAEKFNNPSAFVAKDSYLLSMGDTTGIIADCRHAIALMKGSPTPALYNNFGQAYSQLNMPDSAFNYFNKAIQLDTNFSYGYFQRGNSKLKFADTTGACKDWNEAAKLGYIDTTGMLHKYCSNAFIKN